MSEQTTPPPPPAPPAPPAPVPPPPPVAPTPAPVPRVNPAIKQPGAVSPTPASPKVEKPNVPLNEDGFVPGELVDPEKHRVLLHKQNQERARLAREQVKPATPAEPVDKLTQTFTIPS